VTRRLHIVHLEDERMDAELVEAHLSEHFECTIDQVSSRAAYEAALTHRAPDLILADYSLPGFDGLQALEIARRTYPDVPFLFVTGALSDDRAVETLRLGATDFVVKHRIDRLVPAVKRALDEARERRERIRVQRSLKLLLDASALLASSLDVDATLSNITKLAIVELCDWCIVDLHPDVANESQRLTVAARDPHLVELTHELRHRYPIQDIHVFGPARVTSTARPELHETITDELLVARARDPQHLAQLRKLSLRSSMTVPMRAGRRALGAITFVLTRENRHYDAHDLETAQDLADRAAVAIDNALLHGKLQAALREREELMRIVSHDLRTPLGYIATSSSLLRSALPPDLPRAAQWADGIARSANEMQRLISDLLDMAKLESGTFVLARDVVNLRQIIEDTFEIVAWQAKQRGVELIDDVDRSLSLYLDRDRIAQVVANLVVNAIKFTRSGGRITVRARKSGADVEITVEDTGVGMAAEDLAHVFEPYWQGTQRGTQGVGLGLSIVARLIKAHGGTIAVESEIGRGTVFRISLPNTAGDRAPLHVAAPPSVLVVDDDAAIRSTISALLEEHGYRVDVASNGAEALDRLRSTPEPPSVILLDVMMPVMDGISFREEQERDDAISQIPVVVFSAYGNVAETALKMHAVAHLQKPLRAGDLLETVERATRHGAPAN
jgi:signal transduction histidine kinase/CheY-like chemotaxis protein